MTEPYWRKNHSAPFATMLRVLDYYCHPESPDDAHDELLELVREPNPTDKMVRFKEELRQVLSGHTEGLHPEAISMATQYDDGSDDAYLRRLWSELYPEEAVPEPAAK